MIFRGACCPGAPTYCQYPPTGRRNLSKGPEVTHIAEEETVKRLSKSISITAHALRRRSTDCNVIFLCQDFAYLQKVHQLPNWMSRGLRSQWFAAECKTYLGKNVDRCRESQVYAAFGKRDVQTIFPYPCDTNQRHLLFWSVRQLLARMINISTNSFDS